MYRIQDRVEKLIEAPDVSGQPVHLLYEKYGRTPATLKLATAVWKYTNPRSSGALSTLSTLKSYGLINVNGLGESQKVSVSDVAERVIRNAPDSKELLKAAAILPSLHKEAWDKYEGKLPHDDILRDYLKWERNGGGFTDDAVGGFIDRLRSTMQYAGLLADNDGAQEEHKTDHLDTSNNGNGPEVAQKSVQVGSFVQWTSKGVNQFPAPAKIVGINGEWAFVEASQTGIPMSELTVVDPPKAEVNAAPPANPYYKPPSEEESAPAAGTAKEQKKLDEGQAVLTWPDDLSQESVQDLEYWLMGVLRRARRKAGLPADPNKPPSKAKE